MSILEGGQAVCVGEATRAATVGIAEGTFRFLRWRTTELVK